MSADERAAHFNKQMVSYIYQNYREIISLDDIASAGNVSVSKCCILFKKYLQQFPIDFVNSSVPFAFRYILVDLIIT